MNENAQSCELCASPGGTTLWETAGWRVVRVADGDYPGFCRVIWKAHVREMSDLPPVDRHALMAVVFAVEQVVRQLFAPDKINLACFGNVVPHLHWHIIPRWHDDRHFPQPIWGQAQRTASVERPAVSDGEIVAALRPALQALADGHA